MNTPTVTEMAERLLNESAEKLTTPQDGECLPCFVLREIDEFGCDNTRRFALRYQSLRAPRATGLLDRLSRMGACCCDCELFMNSYRPDREALQAGGHWQPAARAARVVNEGDDEDAGALDHFGDDDEDEEEWPDGVFPCAGVRIGSTQACQHWERRYRGR